MRNLELILNKLLKDEKHQTWVSLLLELVSDAYLTTNRFFKYKFLPLLVKL